MAVVVSFGLLRDYEYLFFVNKYVKPPEFYWPLVSLWWSFHGGLWIDSILIPWRGRLRWGLRSPGGPREDANCCLILCLALQRGPWLDTSFS